MESCPISNQPCEKPKGIQYCLIKGNETNFFNLCQSCPSLCGIKDEIFSACSTCGSTRIDIESRGFMGCPNCYAQFSEFAELLINKCQYGYVHVGKRPKCIANMNESQLRNLLRRSVQSEDYETAEACRRQILVISSSADR